MSVQVTTDVHHYDDGSRSREQTIIGDSAAEVIALYRLLAELDARVAAGEALEIVSTR